MSSLPKFIFLAVFLAVVATPVIAESIGQGNGAGISGNNNTVIQINKVDTDIAKQYNDIKASTYISIVNEAHVDFIPSVNMLGIGDAETTMMLYPNEVVSYPAKDMTYIIRSGTPIAVYVIATGNDRDLLDSSESKMEYNPVYHRFEHGIVSPVWIFPKFTTKCSFSTTGGGYIVLDNRYFPDYTMVEVIPVPMEA